MATDQNEEEDRETSPQSAIVNVLPEGVFRGAVARLPKDNLFPLFEPIFAFGGITSYFLIAMMAKAKRYRTASFMASMQALCIAIGHAPEDSAFLRYARKVYLTLARRSLPVLEFLEPVPPHKEATRPRCLFLIPHGLFCIAGKRYCTEVTSTGRQRGMCFFVDDKLCALSPMMRASARMCGATNVYPVGDKYVRAAMDKREDCVVFPGGFIEASCTSRSCLRIYTGVYGYWVTRCIENGYDIELAVIYHGSEIWDQGEAFFEPRLAMAKKGMPGIMPTLPYRTALACREIFYSPPQLEPGSPACVDASRKLASTIIKDIVAAYANDAATVLELTGKPLKRLEIVGKPLVGELPKGVQDPKTRRSSMSRL